MRFITSRSWLKVIALLCCIAWIRTVSGHIAGCYLSSLCPLCASLISRLPPDLLPSTNRPHFSVGQGQALCTPPDGKHGNMVVSQLTSKYSQALCEKVITDYWIQIRRKLAPCKAEDHQEWRVRKGPPGQNAPKWPSGSVSCTSLIRVGSEELKISLYRDGQLIFSQQIMAMINKLLLLIPYGKSSLSATHWHILGNDSVYLNQPEGVSWIFSFSVFVHNCLILSQTRQLRAAEGRLQKHRLAQVW